MKSHTRRAAAIVLALALSVGPAALASSLREDRGRDRDVPERIIRIIKKFQRLFGGVTVTDDLPGPPKP